MYMMVQTGNGWFCAWLAWMLYMGDYTILQTCKRHILPPFSVRHWTYSSQPTVHFLLWYLRSFTLRRMSSVMRPSQPALWIALSMVSILFHPCYGAI